MNNNGSTMVKQADAAIEEKQEEPINVENWRKNDKTVLVLPSGQRVKVKKISLFELVVAGKIPDGLTNVALSIINSKEEKALDKKVLIENEEMVNLCVLAAVVEPPLAEVPDADHIGIREINWADRTFIFDWVNGVAQSLNSFRKK